MTAQGPQSAADSPLTELSRRFGCPSEADHICAPTLAVSWVPGREGGGRYARQRETAARRGGALAWPVKGGKPWHHTSDALAVIFTGSPCLLPVWPF